MKGMSSQYEHRPAEANHFGIEEDYDPAYRGNTNVLGHIIWTCIAMLLLYAGLTVFIRVHSIQERTAGSSEHARYEARR